MNHAVRVCQDWQYAQLEQPNVLLELEVSVHRYQYLETLLRTVQKFAVLDALPAQSGNSGNLVIP